MFIYVDKYDFSETVYNVKNQYCEQNDIKLLRISYKEDVEGKLKQYLKLLL